MSKNQVLRSCDGRKYAGKWVVLSSFASKAIISSGKNPEGAIKRAQKKGLNCPLMIYVPRKNERFIFFKKQSLQDSAFLIFLTL